MYPLSLSPRAQQHTQWCPWKNKQIFIRVVTADAPAAAAAARISKTDCVAVGLEWKYYEFIKNSQLLVNKYEMVSGDRDHTAAHTSARSLARSLARLCACC